MANSGGASRKCDRLKALAPSQPLGCCQSVALERAGGSALSLLRRVCGGMNPALGAGGDSLTYSRPPFFAPLVVAPGLIFEFPEGAAEAEGCRVFLEFPQHAGEIPAEADISSFDRAISRAERSVRKNPGAEVL